MCRRWRDPSRPEQQIGRHCENLVVGFRLFGAKTVWADDEIVESHDLTNLDSLVPVAVSDHVSFCMHTILGTFRAVV